MDRYSRIEVVGDEELQLSAEQVRAVLADRARKLSHGYSQPPEPSANRVQLIAFRRGDHRYGVELEHLTEIRPLMEWTRVPGIPDFYLGVIQLRGEIIAVVDTAVLFGAPAPPAHGERFAVVVSAGEFAAGLLADSIDDVHDLPPERIHPPLTTFTSSRERYIRGLTEDGLAILDVETLVADDWLRVTHEPTEERR